MTQNSDYIHPNAYTKEELDFIGNIRQRIRFGKNLTWFKGCDGSIPMLSISEDDFVKLCDLLRRWPTWELNEETGEYDYDKPIVSNCVYTNKSLEFAGIENILVSNVPVVVMT